MKTITKTLPTGIKTIQKKSNGIIKIIVDDSKVQTKFTKTQKFVISTMAMVTIIGILVVSWEVYGTMNSKTILILSPLILFQIAVFTAFIKNTYLLIFKS